MTTKTPLRLCVLESADAPGSPFLGLDPACDPAPHLAGHHVEHHVLHKATSAGEVRALAARGFDVFINLCDGARDEERAGLEVIHALEELGAAYTGAGPAFYEPSRAWQKERAREAGIDAPRGVLVQGEAGLEGALSALAFPLLVKHPESYGSIGMTKCSQVENAAALRSECERMIARFGGALVEEFIVGREFTVLVAEDAAGGPPCAYAPVECAFPPGETFKHFELKWIDYAGLRWLPVDDRALSKRLREAGARVFSAMSGEGYGRCDLRLTADGRIFFLEMNANCGLFYPRETAGSADEILLADPGGYPAFLERIIALALTRRHAGAAARGL